MKYPLITLLVCITLCSRAQITVTNTDENGAGSLRQAVADANANAGADEIVFDATLDGLTITLDSALFIKGETTIDGDIDNDGTPNIVLKSGSTGYSGIVVLANNCVIEGLNIYGFSGASQAAILIDDADGTTILSCYLGTDLTGNSTSVADNHSGIYVKDGSINTQIGDGSSARMNVIGGNSFGIRIAGSSNNTIISGNRIGLGEDGSTEISNSRGIDIFSSSDTQIGVIGELENFISGNTSEGIRINDSPNTIIVNNRIGVNETSSLERGNGAQGIYFLNGSNDGEIGSTDPGGRNIISGNKGSGIDINDSDNITVLNNYIGLGIDGTTAIGNGSLGPAGIRVQGTSANAQIGDGTSAGRNIVSAGAGVGSAGILINSGPTYVYGNYIGTNAAGDAALGNGNAGIVLATNGSGQIGGTTAGQGNVISGNSYGIGVSVGGFLILGNYIGTNADGTAALANLNQGIRLSVGSSTQIGDGTLAGANIISGNTSDGILIENASTTGNTINYNLIGVGSDEETAIPNGGNGVLIESDANGNTIFQNQIANNTENGIELGEAFSDGIEHNTITENSIHSNGGEGILITNSAQEGILPPTITSTLNGLIEGTSGANATIEIFADAEDEGEQYLATTTADGSGNWSHQVTISAINSGLSNVSATQTDANGNTSEFDSEALETTPFITTWKTDNTGDSENDQITIPTTGTGYDYTVYWEDVNNPGTNNEGAEIEFTDANTPHTITFPAAGTYRVEIIGDFPRIYFNYEGDREKILTIEQWGHIAWSSMVGAFHGCSNLTVPATDVPDLSSVANTARMFQNATSFNADINDWDVSNVTLMAYMFGGASSFNQDLDDWNVSLVTSMAFMFSNATAFNGDVSTWNVGNVDDMRQMFRGAATFNQSLNDWNVTKVEETFAMFYEATSFNGDITNWQVDALTDMGYMFYGATAFNQDISGWNVSGVENMAGAFYNSQAFDQDLGNWDISSVTDMTDMLSSSGLSIANYGNTLIGWETLDEGTGETQVPTMITLGAHELTYACGDAANARAHLKGKFDWTISGDASIDLEDPVPNAATLETATFQCRVNSLSFLAPYPKAYDDCDHTITGTTDADFPITESTTITWTYTDNAGHFVTQDQNIVIDDTTAPQPDTETLSDITEECQVQLTDLTAPKASDNCDNGTITGTVNEEQFPITESTSITWTFADSQGNTTEQTQNIVIEDNTAPVADAATLENVNAQCSIDLTDLAIPAATDDCSGSVEGATETTFPITESGVIIWTFTDVAGNQSTQDQEVVIEDTTPPIADVATLETITAQCQVATISAPAATDNCDGKITGIHDASLPITTSTTITWTFSDGSGNETTQHQNVVIEDTAAPLPDLEALEAINSECPVTALTAPAATDNCDGEITGIHDASLPVTASQTVTWTFTDESGNSSAQVQTITIKDVSEPVPDTETLADITAECQITALPPPTATDNCTGKITGMHNLTLPIIESTTVIWTFTDESGNSTSQNQTITIEDITAPAPDMESLEELSDQCQVASLPAPTATDNCSGVITATTDTEFPITASQTLTWTFIDNADNITTQSQTVTILDTTAPVPDLNNAGNITANCEITSLNPPTATDNCDGQIVGTHDADLPIIEDIIVTWTFTDAAGNATTQTQEVVVEDTIPPVPDTEFLDEVMARCASVTLFAPTATDNCNGTITGTTDTEFPLQESQTVTWTYTDESGNETTQTQEVVIECKSVLGIATQAPEWHIYPNPAQESFEVRSADMARIRVFDLSGQLQLEGVTNSKVTISQLRKGIYVVELANESLLLIKR